MPLQYVGNAITKAARAKAGGGFESDIETPAVPAGELAYSAPNGLADGETITVTTDGSGGWDFGPAPTELATLGFGQGLLYTAAIGANFQDHTDPLSGAIWDWEFADFSTARLIHETPEGVRVLRTTGGGGGFVTYRPPELLPENEKVFISRISRMSTDFINPAAKWFQVTDITATTITIDAPWDSIYGSPGVSGPFVAATSTASDSSGVYRFRADPETNSNVIAVTEGDPLANGVVVGSYVGAEEASQSKGLRISSTGEYGVENVNYYNTPTNGKDRTYSVTKGSWGGALTDVAPMSKGPSEQWNGEWVRLDFEAELGTFDTEDGTFTANQFCPAEGVNASYGEDYNGGGISKMLHSNLAGGLRWGGFSWQDFAKGATNAIRDNTDYIIQIGTRARVELADSDVPATTKEAYVLPPIVAEWSASSVKVRLWKGFMSGYTGKYLQVFNASGVFVGSVSL